MRITTENKATLNIPELRQMTDLLSVLCLVNLLYQKCYKNSLIDHPLPLIRKEGLNSTSKKS